MRYSYEVVGKSRKTFPYYTVITEYAPDDIDFHRVCLV